MKMGMVLRPIYFLATGAGHLGKPLAFLGLRLAPHAKEKAETAWCASTPFGFCFFFCARLVAR